MTTPPIRTRPSSKSRSAVAAGPRAGPVGRTAEEAGLRRVDVVAWRDLDDAEAGGSELHAHEILTAVGRRRHRRPPVDVPGRWGGPGHRAAAVIPSTAAPVGMPSSPARPWPGSGTRSGRGRPGRDLERDAVLLAGVDHCPRVVFLHHVHAEMWDMALSPAWPGWGTASSTGWPRPSTGAARSSRCPIRPATMVPLLHFSRDRVTVVPPGIDTASPGRHPRSRPLRRGRGPTGPGQAVHLFVEAMVALKDASPGSGP